MVGVGLILTVLLPLTLAIPPLTDDERTILETVEDDQWLFREDAGLDALLLNLQSGWNTTDDLDPFDFDPLLQSPADHRGEAGMITGRVVTWFRHTFAGNQMAVWMIKPSSGDPVVGVLAYEQVPPLSDSVSLQVVIPARFYKRYLHSRYLDDGTGLPTLLFVGTNSVVPDSTATPPVVMPGPLRLLIIVLISAAVMWFFLRGMARRATKPLGHRSHPPPPPLNDGNLPEEPAEALAELRHRAEDASHE